MPRSQPLRYQRITMTSKTFIISIKFDNFPRSAAVRAHDCGGGGNNNGGAN